MSGHFNADLFKKSYDFLDTLKDQEIVTLQKDITKEKDPIMAEKLRRGLEILVRDPLFCFVNIIFILYYYSNKDGHKKREMNCVNRLSESLKRRRRRKSRKAKHLITSKRVRS